MNFLKNNFAEYAFNPPPPPPDFVIKTFEQNAKIQYITDQKIPVVVVQRKETNLREGVKKLVIRLVYTHGNSELIYYVFPRLIHIADHIFAAYKENFDVFVTVVAWTYPGFHPFFNENLSRSRTNIELCSNLVWGELPNLDGFSLDQEHIVVEIAMGYSIGTYPASILNKNPCRPSIIFLVTPFSKLPSGAGMYQSLETVTGPLFNNLELLKEKTPSIIFLLFGQDDTTLPYKLNKELTDIKHVKYIVLQGYKHEDFGYQQGVHQSLVYLCDLIDDVIEAPDNVVSDVIISIRATPSPDTNINSIGELLKELNINTTHTVTEKEDKDLFLF